MMVGSVPVCLEHRDAHSYSLTRVGPVALTTRGSRLEAAVFPNRRSKLLKCEEGCVTLTLDESADAEE